MPSTLASETVHARIHELLLAGDARTASEAEAMFLDAHLTDILWLAAELDDESCARHEAVKLLMAHGSRPWEDCVRWPLTRNSRASSNRSRTRGSTPW